MSTQNSSLETSKTATLAFALAIFASAFLLFQVQPLVSKAILPWFGGSPGVWTTCLLFFQTLLFAGYAYAHLLVKSLSPRWQVVIHVGLVVVAACLLRGLPGASWQPSEDNDPTLSILAVLSVSVGLPYFLLSASGPLLQRWFSLRSPGKSPYRLYAVSNTGSLVALLTYPVVFEPLLELDSQAWIWSLGFVAYLVLAATCGSFVFKTKFQNNHADEPRPSESGTAHNSVSTPSRSRLVMIAFLAMIASASLLAITNTVCLDIAVVPFLWVVPLSLYLLSFILCFDSDRWYWRQSNSIITCLLIALLCYLEMFDSTESLLLELGLYLMILFGICMMCHGEVARLRPDPKFLTSYYLTISAGGAAGGLFVAVVAPAIFPDFWELHLCLIAAICVGLWTLFQDRGWVYAESPAPLFAKVAAILLLVLVGTLFLESISNSQNAIAMRRNFYGVLEVEFDEIDNAMVMRHGNIVHGIQLLGAGRKKQPTTYYSERTGVGRAIELQQSRKASIRIGLVGLGTGTLATYGRESDELRFYEINEDVVDLANEHFTFLDQSSANIEMISGDARLSMVGESPQNYDVLVLDAFSGDAIPTHLLTREAFEIYLNHLNEDGIIAVHISNLYFNLRPVVDAMSDEYDLASTTIIVPEIQEPVDPSSEWILLARDSKTLDANGLQRNVASPQPERVLWTDSFSNLFRILR